MKIVHDETLCGDLKKNSQVTYIYLWIYLVGAINIKKEEEKKNVQKRELKETIIKFTPTMYYVNPYRWSHKRLNFDASLCKLIYMPII